MHRNLIPHTKSLTAKRLIRQVFPHPKHRPLRRSHRKTWISPPPLSPIQQISVTIRRQLDIQSFLRIPRQSLLANHREHLTRIPRPRRRPTQNRQRIHSHVLRRNHVLHRRLSQNLRLIKHQNTDIAEPATKPRLPSTKQNPRAIRKQHSLITPRPNHLNNMRRHPILRRHPRHRRKRLLRRLRTMRRPNHRQPRIQQTQRKRHRRKQIRLPHLPRNRHRHQISRIHAIRALTQNQLPRTILPRIKIPPQPATRIPHRRPPRRRHPSRGNHMPGNLRQTLNQKARHPSAPPPNPPQHPTAQANQSPGQCPAAGASTTPNHAADNPGQKSSSQSGPASPPKAPADHPTQRPGQPNDGAALPRPRPQPANA